MRRPDRLLFDVRGTPIRVGCTVAYNISGDVALGEVVKATPPFHIMLKHPAAGQPAGHISKVRRTGSLLVLLAGD